MYNGGKIILGLIIFLALAAFPFYSNLGGSAKKAMPSLDTPVIQQLAVKECVKPGEYMKREHMKVLDQWRDEVVREGKREKIQVGGREFEKSLQNGCMACHSNKEQFCAECHGYAGVKPYCWDCHLSGEGGQI
ncbi:MAG: sulfate reduction electron transfer complex DsrMKJOP subunit DsrJ [Nitrospiraceae bacterium]|nr:MAG: sulfate reduction electron transfer complex DsrMKJOP subunit DsrJ [Nitrospiraceae bacterium]